VHENQYPNEELGTACFSLGKITCKIDQGNTKTPSYKEIWLGHKGKGGGAGSLTVADAELVAKCGGRDRGRLKRISPQGLARLIARGSKNNPYIS
jgi:hypothetical protein